MSTYYERHKEERLAYARKSRQEHPERLREQGRKYRAEHEEEIRLRKQKYRETHGEEIRAYSQKYRQEHREERTAWMRRSRAQYSQERLEARRARAREYYWSHRDEERERSRKHGQTERGHAVRRQCDNRRRALKAGLPSTLTHVEWESALAYFDHRCAYCGAPAETLQQEHVIPLSAVGGYVRENIVPACGRCNRSKRNTFLTEWASGCGAPFLLPDAVASVEAYLESVNDA